MSITIRTNPTSGKRQKKSMLSQRSIRFAAIASLLALLCFSGRGQAADFQIQPTTLQLSGGVKSGAFSVINNGNGEINFQISVKEWTQDANGKDVYTDTKDIVFFPKIMTTAPHEQRAIRVGYKAPLSTNEKTYRLFVEEIPSPKKESDEKDKGKVRAGITIAFRFATPIFVRPLKPEEAAVVETTELVRGTVRATIRNTGNVHVKLQNVVFRGRTAGGRELFSKEVAGWYLLHGIAVPYEAAVPMDACAELSVIDVSAKSENFTINGSLNVTKDMCTK